MRLPQRYVQEPGYGIGAGGMSRAHVCRDIHLDRLVLIKELQNGVEQRRIRDEIAALAEIRSKHVVQIYDVIVDLGGSVVGLVEEYLPGSELEAVIPVPDLGIFLRVAYSIACGIADIHGSGRIHRDIKPANMRFDSDGCLKIFDFGLARSHNADAETVGAIGTTGYMAPEICVENDEFVSFSPAIDVYAFGATLLKLIRGRVPASLRAIVPTVSSETDFGQQVVSLAGDVAGTLNACLAHAPGDRPAMAAVRDVLARQILRDRHRATMVAGSGVYVLDGGRRAVQISLGQQGTLSLSYNGFVFQITAASGAVFVNNIQVRVPHDLPGACVITVGAPEQGARRAHITVDVSHPEVVL